MRRAKRNPVFLIILSLSMAWACYRAEAQELPSDESLLFADIPVVVTASKREQKISESPSAISIVTAEDIKQSGATQLDEALSMVMGMHMGYVLHGHMDEGGIRGMSKLPANKIVLLIDGMPYSFEAYGIPAQHDLPIVLEEVKRIEVLRGPGSSLYGANAMLGVINVITKDTKDTQGNFLSLTAGEIGTYIANYMNGGSVLEDKLRYRVSTSFDTREGWDYIANANNPVQRMSKVSTKIDYDLNDNSSLQFFGNYTRLFEDSTAFASIGPVDFGDSDLYTAQLVYRSKAPDVMVRAFHNRDILWKHANALGIKNYTSSINGTDSVEFQHTFEPINRDIFVWGMNYTKVLYNTTTKDRSNYMHGVFFDNTYKFTDKLHFVSGLRFDHHNVIGDSLSRRLSFLYFPWIDERGLHKEDRFRFIWGNSYRNPDFIELYYVGSSGGTPVLGHSDNESERAENFELGYLGNMTKKLSFEANMFYTKVINYLSLVNNGATLDFQNLEPLYQMGQEVELKYAFTEWLSGVLNYTYLNQWNEQLADGASALKMTPQNLFNGELRAKFKNGFSVNLQLHYVGATEWANYNWFVAGLMPKGGPSYAGGKAGRYVIANLRVGYSFKLHKNDAEISVAAFNLFDTHFDDYPINTQDISRRVTATLTYKF